MGGKQTKSSDKGQKTGKNKKETTDQQQNSTISSTSPLKTSTTPSTPVADIPPPSDPPPADDMLFTQTPQAKVNAESFQLLKVVGKGSFGKVMLVKKKDDGKIYAMKVLNKQAIISRNQVIHTRSEKSILQMVQHPFIVTLHYAFQTTDKLYMILDYVNGGELFFHLKKEGKFTESRVKFYASQIALAMSHLHSLDIVYRDLKPENILLDSNGHVVITDFGLSKQIIDPSGTHTFCGTPEYLAPEVLRGQGHGAPVDWWSLGTLIYEMLTGLPPFYSANTNVMYQKILTGDLKFPSDITQECKMLLEGLLERDPSRRLTGEQVKTHPWFIGIDWNKMLKKEIPSPWKPPVVADADISQIDPSFTAEPAKLSPPEPSAISTAANTDGGQFVGFTYMPTSEMAQQ
jgi:serine/threonine protein kinase